MISRILSVLAFASLASAASAQSAEIAASVTDDRGRPVADAVVVAIPAGGGLQLPARARANVVDQVDKEFIPKVQAVLVGTSISFPNNDNVRHHVYSFSAAKRFELPLYAGVPAEPVLFDKPGIVVDRVQHPRLDDRICLRFRVTLLREDRQGRQGDA